MTDNNTGSLFSNFENQDNLLKIVEEAPVDSLNKLIECSKEIFIKKMSLNDWEWAVKKNKHQNGPLIPKEQRDGNFFPARQPLDREPGKPPIYLVTFNILWPQTGEILTASLRHFTSKDEAHLTGVPKNLFTEISPASFVVIGKGNPNANQDCQYQAVIVDSASEEAITLTDLFHLSPTFLCGQFTPSTAISSFQDTLFDFIEQALASFNSGSLSGFAKTHAMLPEPQDIAVMAQRKYMEKYRNVANLNPFTLSAPGDCLMEISRGIEFEIFREYELRQRSLELISAILGDEPQGKSIDGVFRNIIRNFPRIDKILLSASQTRKSRAGRSFEYHIETMLRDGHIPHNVQMIMTSKRRPDFILPSFELYNQKGRPHEAALVLSAKTTLRERWKQVEGEIKNCDLYLATVDDKIAENAIVSMRDAGIKLVVPESLKKSKITVYENQSNVISFKDFFANDLREMRYPFWDSLNLLKPSRAKITGKKTM